MLHRVAPGRGAGCNSSFLRGALVRAAIAGFGLEHKADYSLGFLGSSRTGSLLLKSEIATRCSDWGFCSGILRGIVLGSVVWTFLLLSFSVMRILASC